MESALKVKGAEFILLSLHQKSGIKNLRTLKLIGNFKTILELETNTPHWGK